MVFKIRRKRNKQASREPPLFARQSSEEFDVDKGDDEFFNPAPAMKRVPDPPPRKKASGLRGMFKKKKNRFHKSPATQLPTVGELTFNSSDHDGSWETDEIELVLEAREDGTETRRSLEECGRDSAPYESIASREKLAEAVSRHCSSASEDSTVYNLMMNEIAQDFPSDGLMDPDDRGESSIKRDADFSSNGPVKDEADNFEIEAGPADHKHGERTTNRDTGSSFSDVKVKADNFEIEAEYDFSMRGTENHVVETNDSVSVETEYTEDESQPYFSEVAENASSWNSSGEDDDKMGNDYHASYNRTESTEFCVDKEALRRCSSLVGARPEKILSTTSAMAMRKSRSEVISREEKEQHSDRRASLAQSQHTHDSSVFDDDTTWTEGESLREMAIGVTTTAGESTWTEGASTFDEVSTFDESEVYEWKNMHSFDSWLSIQNELKGGYRSDCLFCGAWIF
jgi:hypothetical protein